MLLDEDHPYNCAGNHEGENVQCLINNKEVELSMGCGDTTVSMTVTLDNYDEFVEKVHEANIAAGGKPQAEYMIMQLSDLCPMAFFDTALCTALDYWAKCDGLNIKSPEEYSNTPAIWVQICKILDYEYNKWTPVKQAEIASQKERQAKRNK